MTNPKAYNNYAYIDGQNLHMGTSKSVPSWAVDLKRLRVYLSEKYSVSKAFYYLGYIQVGVVAEKLYEEIQSAGFVLVFRQHNSAMLGKKKGNVDSDIIFNVMKRIQLAENFDKVVLVSGDGDYKMLVDFLIEIGRFKKILFPNKKFSSSLYKEISSEFFASLDQVGVKQKIQVPKK
jgi:uncharacterized LabA/DUF88 family protein